MYIPPYILYSVSFIISVCKLVKIERVNHSFTEQITQTHSPRRVFKPYLFTPTFCKSRTHKTETIIGVKFNFCIFLCHNRLVSVVSVFNSYDVIHKVNYQVVNYKDIFRHTYRDRSRTSKRLIRFKLCRNKFLRFISTAV